MSNPEKIYYTNGNIRDEMYISNDGGFIRREGPAWIKYFNNGNVKNEFYYDRYSLHRNNKPAWIEYYPNGALKSEAYFSNGKRHREDGPAVIDYNENGDISDHRYYYKNNMIKVNDNEEFLKYVEEKKLLDYFQG